MAEIYPSDSELLNIVSDEQTGVEYIPTGTAPYYLHFRRLLYRLLLSCRRANDLRVYREGGLEVGVKPGRFWVHGELVEYSGSAGNVLADDTESIYLYLDSGGNLVKDEYTGFPDMSTAAHIRLAVVTTSGGEVTSIVDARDQHNISLPFGAGGVRRKIESHTTDASLSAAQSCSIHTNLGAAEVVTLTLPESAPAGCEFTFAVQAAQELRVDPGSATIRDDSGQTADKYKSADATGACLTLAADANGDWVTLAKNGTWTEEA